MAKLKKFKSPKPDYRLVNTKKLFVPFFKELMQQGTVACDTETNDSKLAGFRHVDHHIIGISFSWAPNTGYYIPVRHISGEKNLDPSFAFKWLREFYQDEDVIKVWWNGKYDKKHLRREETGIIIPKGRQEDGMIACHLVNENEKKALEWQASTYVQEDAGKYDRLLQQFRLEYSRLHEVLDPDRKSGVRKMYKEEVHYGYVPFEIMVPYASSDTDFTLQRWLQLESELGNGSLRDRYDTDLEMNEQLVDVEDQGVLIDSKYFNQKSKKVQKTMNKALRKFHKRAGKEVNIGSPKQLAEVFRGKGIKVPQKRRDSGEYTDCLDKDALQKVAKKKGKKYRIAQDILDYREVAKTKSTYLDTLPLLVQADGMVHGSNNVCGAVTGRSSMSDPNLMNQPRGPLVRSGFIVPDGFIWLKPDFSQIEIRLGAIYSKDRVMVRAYKSGKDVHVITAKTLLNTGGKSWKKLDPAEQKDARQKAKAVNFGLMFDMHDETLIDYARQSYGVTLTPREGMDFYEAWHRKYYGYSRWMDTVRSKGNTYGEVTNLFGRVRRTPELLSPNTPRWLKSRQHRQLINFLIQGSAGDLFKIVFVKVYNYLKKMKAKSRIIIQVHDEIDMYLHKDEFHLLPEIIRLMEDWDFDIPIKVEVEFGFDWGHLKELVI